MKYNYSVIYEGKFYRAGEEVPVVAKKAENKESSENEESNTPSDSEKTVAGTADKSSAPKRGGRKSKT